MRLAVAIYVLFAAHTVFVGLCLGFTGHADNFPQENPRLYQTLIDELSGVPESRGPRPSTASWPSR